MNPKKNNPEEKKKVFFEPIAIVGIGCLLPGSTNPITYWKNIIEKKDLMTDIPPDHWLLEEYYDQDWRAPDKSYSRKGAFLSKVPFDPMEFGIPPNVLPHTDSSQLLGLLVAKEALKDAFGEDWDKRIDHQTTAVIVGASGTSTHAIEGSSSHHIPIWMRAMRQCGVPEDRIETIHKIFLSYVTLPSENTFPGSLLNVISGRIANRFDLQGTNCTVDAACASSLSAVHLSAADLLLRKANLAITGGVQTTGSPVAHISFSKTPALSPTGVSRPFDANCDGMMVGEGLALFVLKRLSEAERDGDKIYAVIRGIGSSSDGRAKSIYAPEEEGQARALRRAYESAGYGPDTVEMVEAHGTGTRAGDAVELKALSKVFAESGRADPQWCAVGSVKSQIGHTGATAGAAGLLKAVLALHHKVLPPTINVQKPTEAIDLKKSPFYINTESRPWIHSGETPRRAGVSAFGFGGTNFHVALEEYTGSGRRPDRLDSDPCKLSLYSGNTPQELLGCETFSSSHPYRLALITEGVEDLQAKLKQVRDHLSTRPDAPLSLPTGVYYLPRFKTGKIAFLFPGHGSQSLNMGADLAVRFDVFREVWDRADRVPLDPSCRLSEVVFPRSMFDEGERKAAEERLIRAEWAQPALMATCVAMAELLKKFGVSGDMTAGHSFGESTALYYAGANDLERFLEIARKRGEIIAESEETPGGMVAVSGDAAQIKNLLDSWKSNITIANYNSPRQVILSGGIEELQEIQSRLDREGFKTIRLRVATAFHSPVVQKAVDPYYQFLSELDFSPPQIGVYSNTTAAKYPSDPHFVARMMANQIGKPVRFHEEILAMHGDGANIFLEVGPGGVLTRLVDECLEGKDHVAISLDRKGRNGVLSFLHALGQLAAAGVPLDLSLLHVREVVESKKSPVTVWVDGTTYGKKYPPQIESRMEPVAVAKPMEAEMRVAVGHDLVPQTAGLTESPALFESGTTVTEPSLASPSIPETRVALPPEEIERLLKVFLEVVSEKTGYPPEILKSDMDLEADLGIDSIKRVEILSAFREREPHLPEIPIEQIAAIRTIAQIADFVAHPPLVATQAAQATPLSATAREEAAPILEPVLEVPFTPPGPTAPQPTQSRIALPPEEIERLLKVFLEVVSEKTGYPPEILKPDMDLEADLGIDSIKRVEILSAFREREPHLPEIPIEQIAAIRTIAQIADFVANPPSIVAPPIPAMPVRREPPPEPVERPAPTPASAVRRFEIRSIPCAQRSVVKLAPGREVLIVSDGRGVAEELAKTLVSRGFPSRIVSGDQDIRPELPCGAVIYLGGLRELSNVAAGIKMNKEAFRVAKAVAERVCAAAAQGGGWFIAVQDSGGDFGLSSNDPVKAVRGGLAGLTKTVGREWPSAYHKIIDIQMGLAAPGAIASLLADEILSGGEASEVGLTGRGDRITLKLNEVRETSLGPLPIDEKSVIVVSGGARGVTARCVIELARQARPKIVLFGRSPVLEEEPEVLRGITNEADLKKAIFHEAERERVHLSPHELEGKAREILHSREVKATLDALREHGSPVKYYAVDLLESRAIRTEGPSWIWSASSLVRTALAEVRQEWGPITGLIHGAGNIADRFIKDKTTEQFDAVFDTKVRGLYEILSVLEGDPLRLICFFSSISGRFGNRGQSDYAMANEILNKVAQAEYRRRKGQCLVKSINWGAWDGGMMPPFLRQELEKRGFLMSLNDGAQAFVRELRDPSPDAVEVVVGQLPNLEDYEKLLKSQ